MSYSRWGSRGSGTWYTFNCVSDAETRDEEIFEVCMVAQFTYKDIKGNMDKCIEHVKGVCETSGQKHSKKIYNELKEYMKEFMADMEKDYPKTASEKYKDGEITIEEAFVEEV